MIKQYKIFQHQDGTVKAVKQGWSWPAFFFSFIWAILKKMYLTGIALFFLSFLLGTIVGHLNLGQKGDTMINIISIAISIIFGLKGNEWWEAMLYRRGFEAKALLEAVTPQAALALFYQQK